MFLLLLLERQMFCVKRSESCAVPMLMCAQDVLSVCNLLALGHNFRKNVNFELLLFCADVWNVIFFFRFPTMSNERSNQPVKINHHNQFLNVDRLAVKTFRPCGFRSSSCTCCVIVNKDEPVFFPYKLVICRFKLIFAKSITWIEIIKYTTN